VRLPSLLCYGRAKKQGSRPRPCDSDGLIPFNDLLAISYPQITDSEVRCYLTCIRGHTSSPSTLKVRVNVCFVNTRLSVQSQETTLVPSYQSTAFRIGLVIYLELKAARVDMSPSSESQNKPFGSSSGPEETSAPTSPTDTRHPLSRYESITSDDEGQTSGYQTETVRRRPEAQAAGYGMCFVYSLHSCVYI
jgi:hypothetical protein